MGDGDLGSVLPRDCVGVPVLVVVVDIGPVGLALGVVGIEAGRHVDSILLKFFVGIFLGLRRRGR
jgi:hypothetical protein